MTIAEDVTKEDYATLSLEAMKERNAARLNSLAHQGVGINDLQIAYIETMLETLLGDRLEEAQVSFEMKVGERLDGIESQVLRMRLGIAP